MLATDTLLAKLHQDGGFTVNPLGYAYDASKGGFGVSVIGAETKLPATVDADRFADTFDVYASYVASENRHAGGVRYYVGAWLDGADIYLDVTEIVMAEEQAIALGRARGQRAIYSFADGRTITIGE